MSEKIEPRRLPGEISSLDEEAARDLRHHAGRACWLQRRIAAQNRSLPGTIYVLT